MANKSFMFVLLLFVLAGCAQVNVPVYARLKNVDKTLLQGSLVGNKLMLNHLSGFHCEGYYPGHHIEPTMIIPMQCNDGQTAQAMITFNDINSLTDQPIFPLDKKTKPKQITGYGQGTFSNGTDFEVFIGRVSGVMKAPSFLK